MVDPDGLGKTWRHLPFAVVDVEGNGQEFPEPVEISIVNIDMGLIGSGQTWLVRPRKPITNRVARLHGISNETVARVGPINEIEGALCSCTQERYFVAHNAMVDWAVLKRAIPRMRTLGILDTLKLARALIPGHSSYALSHLVHVLGLLPRTAEARGYHRADFDAFAAARLFCFLNELGPTPMSGRDLISIAAADPLADQLNLDYGGL